MGRSTGSYAVASERKLRNRKRKASVGRVIRVSDPVYETLNTTRKGRSWDWLMRKLLGLPDRAGNEQVLIEGVLEVLTGKFFLKEPSVAWGKVEQQAYETGFIAAAKQRRKYVPKPLRLKELP